MFTHFFIDRPIFSTVISLVIVLMGAVAAVSLPVSQYPDITPPTISVTAQYPGASAEDVVNAVTVPLEQEINGVDNMIYMTSTSTSDGEVSIVVTFEVGTDPDIATVLVQNRVKKVEPKLPEDVRRYGINVEKRATDMIMFLGIVEGKDAQHETKEPFSLWGLLKHFVGIKEHKEPTEIINAQNEAAAKIISEEQLEDGKREDRSVTYMTNYANLFIKDALARLPGVGQVMVFSDEDFSMRIWFKPEIMAARNISVQEVSDIIREQNVQVAAGRVGVSPVPAGQQTNISITTLGRLENVDQFENMIVRTDEEGGILRLKDIATIELGPQSYSVSSQINGNPSTVLAIMQRPGANSLNVSKAVLAEMERIRPALQRNGIDYVSCYDATEYTYESVIEVLKTLLEAIFVVSLTVYIFLQDWRAALIPILTIPVSLIGTFFFMSLFGFNINVLTLFGLILVIGIVVDDSIVVVENTQRILDEEHCDSVTATKKSMIQVASPVIATALVLIAVFAPTAMITGLTGTLYKQFAITIATAVGISGICALTLSPALCAIFLRPSRKKKFIFFRVFNYCFDAFANFYLFIMKRLVHMSILVLAVWFLIIVGLKFGFQMTPTGFIPDEDQGVVMFDIKLPEGASKERTQAVIDKVNKILDGHRDVIHAVAIINGYSMMESATAANRAFGIATLKPWSVRPNKEQQVDALTQQFMQEFASIPEAIVFAFAPPVIRGVGTTGIELILQDMRPYGNQALAEAAQSVCAEAMQTPMMFVMAMSSFDPNSPRVYLDIDREKVKLLQISLSEVNAALQSYISSSYINDFNAFGRVFRVQVQSEGEFRTDIDNILELKVKNSLGEMVPLKTFCTVENTVGPQVLSRYNLYPAATIRAIQYPFRSTGEAIATIENAMKQLPDGWGHELTGMAFQEQQVGNQAMFVFALSIAFSFLFLAALYESWSSPIVIMMAVPLGVMGALGGVMLRGMSVNVYTQIGLIVMVGLSAKNAILIVEFARDRRHEGMPIKQAAYEAGRLRLRPIMMTSIAFVLGVIPLAIATGAGAAGRQAIGTAVCGGLFNETLIGIFVTPVLFVLLEGLSEKFHKGMQKN